MTYDDHPSIHPSIHPPVAKPSNSSDLVAGPFPYLGLGPRARITAIQLYQMSLLEIFLDMRHENKDEDDDAGGYLASGA